jgi:hypothetical protein
MEKTVKEIQQKLVELHAENLARKTENQQILKELQEVWRSLTIARPNNRSAEDRWYSIAITDIQKIIGYFNHFVVNITDEDIATKNM